MQGQLYELTPIYSALIEQYNEALNDQEQEAILAQLAEVAAEFEDEAANIIAAIKNLKAWEETCKKEKDKFAAMEYMAKLKADNLKKFLKVQIEEAKIPNSKVSVANGVHQAWIQKNGALTSNIAELNATLEQAKIKKLPAELVEVIPETYKIRYDVACDWFRDEKKKKKLPDIIQLEQGSHLRVK